MCHKNVDLAAVASSLARVVVAAVTDLIRILYFADADRVFTLLHGLIKRAQKLDEGGIGIAEQRPDSPPILEIEQARAGEQVVSDAGTIHGGQENCGASGAPLATQGISNSRMVCLAGFHDLPK